MILSNAKKLLWALSIVVLSCGLVGCGEGLKDVSEESAQKSYEKTTKGTSSGDLKVISFRIISARRSERVGEKVCDVEYEAELEYLKGPEKGKSSSLMDRCLFGRPRKVGKIHSATFISQTRRWIKRTTPCAVL
jgi:hypothetical protein